MNKPDFLFQSAPFASSAPAVRLAIAAASCVIGLSLIGSLLCLFESRSADPMTGLVSLCSASGGAPLVH